MSSTRKVVDLGSRATVAQLFSYPPNCHEICFLPQTLEETVRLYVRSSLNRDLFHTSDVTVRTDNDRVLVELTGSAAVPYADMLGRFLGVGSLGLRASLMLHTDKKWRYDWRFYLPLGLAMARHRTVQLLHFPPAYVLARDQDYLAAQTTRRWAELLTVNGVAAHETPLYQNIVDIAPIAASSGDGRNLERVYAYYTDYIVGLLKLWLPTATNAPRPLIAFGSPVRDWIKSTYQIDLEVLSVATIAIAPDLQAPILAANHPSFIYNAADRLKDDPETAVDERVVVLMRIMREDLIAANWQAVMGESPKGDPRATLDECTARWSSAAKQDEMYELTRRQVFEKTPQAASLSARFPAPAGARAWLDYGPARQRALDAKVTALRAELGSLESREPDDIVA